MATEDTPAVWAVNDVTKAASARAATITVDLVERCMNELLMCARAITGSGSDHIVIDTARMSGHNTLVWRTDARSDVSICNAAHRYHGHGAIYGSGRAANRASGGLGQHGPARRRHRHAAAHRPARQRVDRRPHDARSARPDQGGQDDG